MKSIKSRLTLTSMFLLAGFMVLTAVALERAVEQRALRAEEDTMRSLVYSLLAAIDNDGNGGLILSENRLFEADLFTLQSGLYAVLLDARDRVLWESWSKQDLDLPLATDLPLGQWRFDLINRDESDYFRLGFAIQWPDEQQQLKDYAVVVWQDAAEYRQQMGVFRQTLWMWLLISTGLLLLVTFLVARWGLRPLAEVGEEVKAIEDRRQSGFQRIYPEEIRPLTENLNILLKREQYQRQKYRNAMDDLAHSLKTPLAVIKGLLDRDRLVGDELDTLREQSDRMNQIVGYQLNKASSATGVAISKPVDLVAIVERLLAAMTKVYREKSVRLKLDVADNLRLRMDEGDCLEVIGNLLDNAFKYCSVAVSVTAVLNDSAIELVIEDDGKGIDSSEIDSILTRGSRLDEACEGQGIGLSVVADIAKSYNAELSFGCSASLGGLRVELRMQSA